MAVRYPLTPRSDDDRFSKALLEDVAEVLTKHGYPFPLNSRRDRKRLELSLFRFVYALRRRDGSLAIDDRDREPSPEPTRGTIADQLRGDPGVDYSATSRAANYPVSRGTCLPLSADMVGAVARALAEAGWPEVRHKQDWERLARGLRWVGHGRDAR